MRLDMSVVQFDRNAMARCYARGHKKTDPGVEHIYSLPTDAPEREIRFVEVNSMIAEREDSALEPIDFGVDTGTSSAHKLFVLDVTPSQWKRIEESKLPLPHNWSLINMKDLTKY